MTRTEYGISDHASKSILFSDLAQEFLDRAEVEYSTRNSYRDLLNIYWMPTLALRPLDQITTPEIRKVDRETEWPGPKTRKNALSALRQLFQYGVDEEYRTHGNANPAGSIKVKRKKGERARPRPYSAEERDALLNWLQANAPQTPFAYFHTAFFTGMRTGELLALDWPCFRGDRLVVEKARVRGRVKGTKTDDVREVLIPDFTAEIIGALPSRFRKGDVFLNQYNRPYVSAYHLNQYFREAHRKTGVNERGGPYPWRHAYASIGLEAGMTPSFLAKQLGHSLQMFFTKYAAHITKDADREELAKMGSKRDGDEGKEAN